mmetsp:Transcript_12344/g.19177  ORF Transcript_12344/g.19177 Transcript_12344/m.19177 type:complete len:115 (-) Transcript_12344:2095-2439(-)
MNSKIQASTLVSLMHLVVAITFYLLVVEDILFIKPHIEDINSVKFDMFVEHNITTLGVKLDSVLESYDTLEPNLVNLKSSFFVVDVLNYINFFFVLQHFTLFIFQKKMTRKTSV